MCLLLKDSVRTLSEKDLPPFEPGFRWFPLAVPKKHDPLNVEQGKSSSWIKNTRWPLIPLIPWIAWPWGLIRLIGFMPLTWILRWPLASLLSPRRKPRHKDSRDELAQTLEGVGAYLPLENFFFRYTVDLLRSDGTYNQKGSITRLIRSPLMCYLLF